jgi:filamentous hemagglutinin
LHNIIYRRLLSKLKGIKPYTSQYKAALEAELNAIGRDLTTPGSLLNKIVTKQKL